jgi:hypothetical protein
VIVPLQFETEFAQDREDCGKAAKGFPVGVAPGGGGDGRMGTHPSAFTVNSLLSAVRFTTRKSVQFPM